MDESSNYCFTPKRHDAKSAADAAAELLTPLA